MGQLDPLSSVEKTDQILNISTRLFSDEKALCGSDELLIRSLWEINTKGLTASQLVDWGIVKVKLKDGEGRLVQFRRAFKPGDPGVISVADDFYLVSSDCRVMLWGFGQDVH